MFADPCPPSTQTLTHNCHIVMKMAPSSNPAPMRCAAWPITPAECPPARHAQKVLGHSTAQVMAFRGNVLVTAVEGDDHSHLRHRLWRIRSNWGAESTAVDRVPYASRTATGHDPVARYQLRTDHGGSCHRSAPRSRSRRLPFELPPGGRKATDPLLFPVRKTTRPKPHIMANCLLFRTLPSPRRWRQFPIVAGLQLQSALNNRRIAAGRSRGRAITLSSTAADAVGMLSLPTD